MSDSCQFIAASSAAVQHKICMLKACIFYAALLAAMNWQLSDIMYMTCHDACNWLAMASHFLACKWWLNTPRVSHFSASFLLYLILYSMCVWAQCKFLVCMYSHMYLIKVLSRYKIFVGAPIDIHISMYPVNSGLTAELTQWHAFSEWTADLWIG